MERIHQFCKAENKKKIIFCFLLSYLLQIVCLCATFFCCHHVIHYFFRFLAFHWRNLLNTQAYSHTRFMNNMFDEIVHLFQHFNSVSTLSGSGQWKMWKKIEETICLFYMNIKRPCYDVKFSRIHFQRKREHPNNSDYIICMFMFI